MTNEDVDRFFQRGIKPSTYMKSFDVLCQMFNALEGGICKDYDFFALRDETGRISLRPLGFKETRVFKHGRWFRCRRSGEIEKEIPDCLLFYPQLLSHSPQLHLSIDNAAWGIRAMYFMIAPHPRGLELNADWKSDYSHDGWNDVQGACRHAHGGFVFTNIQMTVAYNSNYAPYLTGGNLGSKKEILKEFLQLNPDVPAAFTEDLDLASLDSGCLIPGDAEEQQEQYEAETLRHPNFQKRGYYVRMCIFFSLLQAHRKFDRCWSSWKKLLSWGAQNLADQDDIDAARAQDKISKQLLKAEVDLNGGDMSTADYKKRLFEIKKACLR